MDNMKRCGKEIYVERSYRESNTGEAFLDMKNILWPNRVVLLKGSAGSGKSSVATKLIKRWAEGEEVTSAACVFFQPLAVKRRCLCRESSGMAIMTFANGKKKHLLKHIVT